ncbi:MAG TPA: ATP-dependent Clp protease ATP-binding subunit [Firmicutes bacterium]|nr:ATP-dependent Clp protease ATP-binding subunit [Bacillota bacterium]
MTNRFTENARRVLSDAARTAGELGHAHIGSEHILLAITLDGESTAMRVLKGAGITSDGVRRRIIALLGMGESCVLTADDMTPLCKKLLLDSSVCSRSQRYGFIGSEHLLMAILREDCNGRRIIETEGADVKKLYASLERMFSDDASYGSASPEMRRADRRRSAPTVERNAVDLTARAEEGRIEPLVGREAELDRIVSILLRKTKNNPVLIGEAGVGKTAIVEGLAARIVQGRVPPDLQGKRVYSLSVASLVAGTKYRGEFEDKLKKIVDECREDGDILLFIDELHTIVGAGGAEGAVDASNILKPPLARGEIRIIGATTPKEYRTSVEADSALERRFQPVTVGEPSAAESRRILTGIRGEYERFHGLKITDGAISAAVALSERYLPFRRFPDKAIDLIDEAAGSKRMEGGKRLTAADVARTLGRMTGVPVDGALRVCERVSHVLAGGLFGQDEARDRIAAAFETADCASPNGAPLCSLLLYGPEGCGKTHAASLLAEAVGGGAEGLLRFDMSEFTEPHAVSRLIGSPAGYVGFDEGGALTEAVRRNPYAVLVFENVTRASAEVRALLLRILEGGGLRDATGLHVPFGNTVVVLTSAEQEKEACVGFSAPAVGALPTELRAFADRVDAAVPFVPLTAGALTAIAAAALARAGLPTEQAGALAENARSPRELLRRVRAAAARPLCLLTEAETVEQ